MPEISAEAIGGVFAEVETTLCKRGGGRVVVIGEVGGAMAMLKVPILRIIQVGLGIARSDIPGGFIIT